MERNCEACKYYVTSEDGKTKGCSRWECKYEERMTKEEAQRILKINKPVIKRTSISARRYVEAFDMAISALSADVRPNIRGHWEPKYPTREEIIYCQERYFCSNCKNYVVDRIARLEFNYCPNCGADMRGKAE